MRFDDIRKKLFGLILFRLLIATVLLASSLTFIINLAKPLDRPETIFLAIIGTIYLLSALYLLAVRYSRNHLLQIYTQLFTDSLFWMAMIYITGGLHSPFTFLLAFTIIFAAMLDQRRGAIITTVFSAGLLPAIWLLYRHCLFHDYFGMICLPERSGIEGFYLSFLNVCLLVLTALLASWLTAQVREKEELVSQARIDLEAQKSLTHNILTNLTSGLVLTDIDTRIILANNAAQQEFEERMAGAYLDRFFPGISRTLRRVAAGEDPEARRQFSMEIRRKTQHRTFSFVASPFVDRLGRPLGHIVVFNDVTDQVRAAEEQAEQKRLASIGELASGIAHEIRNPLASISGSIELLREEYADGPGAPLMGIVVSEVERLNRLISDFLLFAGKHQPQLRPVNLTRLAGKVIQMANASLPPGGGIELELDAADPVIAPADEDQLTQVLWNVIKNGIESIEGGHGRIGVAIGRRRGMVALSIEDNGCGMERETAARVFEPFFTTKETGTGMGMAIARRIVLSHKGRIEIDSEPGIGTRLTIWLPEEVG